MLLLMPAMLSVVAAGDFLVADVVLETNALVARGLSLILLMFLLFLEGASRPWVFGSVIFRFRRFFLEDLEGNGDDNDDDGAFPFLLRLLLRLGDFDLSSTSSSSLLLRSRASRTRSVSSKAFLFLFFFLRFCFTSSKS
jgi:hypothetical protein